jgi:hypothetical protein
MLKLSLKILAAALLQDELAALRAQIAERDRLVLDLRRRLDLALDERPGTTTVQLGVSLGGEEYEMQCECDSPREAEALTAGWVLSGNGNRGRVS